MFIGDVEVFVESESLELVNEITEKPIETGQDIADHVRNTPANFTISGVVSGEGAAQKWEQLLAYRNNKEVITFAGRKILDNLVIQSISPVEDNTILDGFKFTLTFRQVRIAEIQMAEIVIPEVIPQARDVADAGTDTTRDHEVTETGRSSLLMQGVDYLRRDRGQD